MSTKLTEQRLRAMRACIEYCGAADLVDAEVIALLDEVAECSASVNPTQRAELAGEERAPWQTTQMGWAVLDAMRTTPEAALERVASLTIDAGPSLALACQLELARRAARKENKS